MTVDEVKLLKVAKYKTSKSLMFFTRYFFKKRFNRKFVVNHHHEKICNALERVLRGETKRLIINIAPRYGKTELAVKNLVAHALAVSPTSRFIHLSYSDDLALDNSEEIRDLIQSSEFQTLFPVKIKKDSNSKKKWYTEEGGGLYSTAAGGQVTGFGAGKVDEEDKENINEFISSIGEKSGFGGAIIIDDPIKPDDAESDTKREQVNNRFDSTIRNRVNSRNTPIIIIMQRLHPVDLCGYLIDQEPDDWEVLSLPCVYKEDGDRKALWPFKHTLEELDSIEKANKVVFERQYLQDPQPREGLLYGEFMTYQSIPIIQGRKIIKAYIDTADTGSDYLCCIIYTVLNGLYYINNVYYTQEANETTEPRIAELLNVFEVNVADIESNSGGRAFARNVQRILKESHKNFKTQVSWFHQSENKQSRIFSQSANVNNNIVMPFDWGIKWKDFYRDVTRYSASGKNKHDDAPDALTGVVEFANKSTGSYNLKF